MRKSAAVLATLVALLAAVPARAGATGPAAAVTYRPPVDAPIVDPFRPPAQDWQAGNRGLEYATTPGTLVGAAAGGEVVFAGPVGGGLHVVVLHDDGLRTSYSFLALVAVHRGDKVSQGQTLGTTQERFHFGVRAGDAYLDPALLFGGGPAQVHLVPEELRRPLSEAAERAGIARMFRGWVGRAVAAGGAVVDWARDRVVEEIANRLDELYGAALYGWEALPVVHVARFVLAAREWQKAQRTCTPATAVAPAQQERHLAVMVAGLGSDSDADPIDTVDTGALGYRHADVVRFSYLGGTTADHPYAPTDTGVDIHQSGRRLRQLLERLEAEHPGIPIDVIAHGEGGIVARTALVDEVDGHDPRLPAVRSLVTLGTPHLGLPLATMATMVGHTTVGEGVEIVAHTVLPGEVDPGATAVAQLAEESAFMFGLNARPLPVGLHVTSIGAREDWMVPAGLTHLDGAHNVTVSAPGHATEHSDMARASETQREIALGLAGMAPTCQSFADFVADAVVSDLIRYAETGVGGALWLAGRQLDDGLDAMSRPSIPTRSD